MKKFRELLKEKRWKWTAGGVACLLIAAVLFSLTTEIGVRADEITLGNETIDLIPIDGEENAYWLENASQLQKLGNAATGTAGLTFRLKNDITFNSVKAPATGNFEGVFDGNGHVIFYQDIDIVVTDENPSSDSVSNGLLFGTVSGGTIQNLIVDVQDSDASYTKKSKNPVNVTVNAPVFENTQNPIVGENEVVSGLSTDLNELQKVNEIYGLETVPGTAYKSHTLSEPGTVTTVYTPGDTSEDYFGLLCGKNTGTIQEVYLTGNAVTVHREELAAMNYSRSEQSGYRNESYFYLQETDSETGAAETVSLSVDGTVYAGNETYTDSIENDELILSVSAAKAAAKGENIVYRVKVENTGEDTFENVTLSATENGTWKQPMATQIPAGAYEEFEFTYSTAEITSNEVALGFSITGTVRGATAAVTVSDVKTVLFDAAENSMLKSMQGLKIEASASAMVEKGEEIVYTITVTNQADETYKNVVLESNLEGTWKNGNTCELAEGRTASFEFHCPTKDLTETEVIAQFTATATTMSAAESAKAIANGLNTKLYETSNYDTEKSVGDLSLKITVPQNEVITAEKTLNYDLIVTNTGDEDYKDLKLSASKEGEWSGAVTTAGTSCDIAEIKAGEYVEIQFTYTYTDEEIASEFISLDFDVFSKKDASEVTVRVSDVKTGLIDVSGLTTDNSEQNLKLEVLAPKAAKKGNTIEYLVKVINESDKAYDKVVLRSSGTGAWSVSELTSLGAGLNETVTYTQSTSADGPEEVTLQFEATGSRIVAAEPEGGGEVAPETKEESATVIVQNVQTKLFEDDQIVSEEKADGLTLKVTAPQKKVTDFRKQIRYTIAVTNGGTEKYRNVLLSSTRKGRWNGEFFEKIQFDVGDISVGQTKEITYVLSYDNNDETTGAVSVDFAVNGETDTTTVKSAVSGVVTDIISDGGNVSDATVQGLEVQVSAPKFAKKGDTLEYTVTIQNKGSEAYHQVKLDSNGTGQFSRSEWNDFGENGTETVIYTQSTTNETPDELVLEFSVTGTDSNASENVKAVISDISTTVYDASEKAEAGGNAGLELSVEAPMVVQKSEGSSIEYTLTLTNKSEEKYTDIKLRSLNKEGKWNGRNPRRDFYDIREIQGNDTVAVTFSYPYTGDESAANEVLTNFSVTGISGKTSMTLQVPNVKTQLVTMEAAYKTIQTANGLTATLEVDNKNIIAGSGESFQYTLTLENTNEISAGFVLAKDINISPNLSTAGWSVSSSTALEFSTGAVNQVIPAGKKVVLTKTVTSEDEITDLSVNRQETLDLTATLTSKAYKYSYDTERSVPANDTFVAHQTAPVNAGTPIVSGNTLYAGAIAGESIGTISSVKQALNLTKEESDGKLVLGTIAGRAENADVWSDFYLLGTVNGSVKYLGVGDANVQRVANTEAEAASLAADAGNAAWASYTNYIVSDTNEPVAQIAGDLSWLINESTFETGEVNQGTIAVNIPEDEKVREAALDYSVAYKARKTMQETLEETLYADSQIVLEKSAFYKFLQAYATDGYYHYYMPENADASMRFPYDNDVNPYADREQFTWEITRRLVDGAALENVQVKLPARGNGYVYGTKDRLYYSVNVPANMQKDEAILPIEPLDGETYCDAAIQYTVTGNYNYSYFAFEIPEIRYGVTPYIDEHIYPMVVSTDFGPTLRESLEPPQIQVFDFYNVDGAENAYIPMKDYGKYEKGSGMKLKVSEVADSYNPSFGYVFSKTAPTEGQWEKISEDSVTIQKYIGTEELSGLTFDTYNGEKLQVDENTDTSAEYYLYIKAESKFHTEVYYCYGPFYIVNKGTIAGEIYGTTDQNAAMLTGEVILEGDYLKLKTDGGGALESSSLQYLISDTEITTFAGQTWNNYEPDSFISLTRKAEHSDHIYVYVRNYQPAANQTRYGKIVGWSYLMQSNSAEVKANPATISYLNGGQFNINAAATLEYNGEVALSTTDDSHIFYVQTETQGEQLKIERVGRVPDTLEAGYFVIGGRCYHIYAGDSPAVQYSAEELIQVNNDTRETKELHLAVVAIKEGCNPSVPLNYVYKVGKQHQVIAPESALVTNRIENGKETEGERADISRGATLFFTSMTPNVEIYYWIGDTVEGEGTKYENGVKVITTGTTYVITLIAKDPTGMMLDSEPVTFVYNIAEAQQTDAPVATPVTSEVSPTVVISGDKILLSSPTTGAVIYYALEGADPVLAEDSETGEYTLVSGRIYEPDKGITMPEEGSGFFTISAVAVKSGLSPSPVVHFSYAYPSSVQAPYASVNNGSVTMGAEVILKNRTEGATIYYTVAYDGEIPEDPTANSSVFDTANPFVINKKTTIKAMAVKDRVNSEVVTFTYSPYAQLKAPTASIESGSVVSGGTVLTLKADDGTTIYYTMDGSDPKENGNVAVMTGTSLILNGESGSQLTIKAYAAAEGKSDSEVATFTYLFSQNPGGVTADVESGSMVSNGSKVNLMTDVTGAEIYHTTNGDSPVDDGIKGTSVTVEGTPGTTFTIKAVAVLNGTPGTVASFTYKIKEIPNTPSATPGGGVLTVAARVSLSSNVEKIFYTIDGSEPTKSSTPYTEPILINRTTVLKAIAVSEDGEVSQVGTYTYFAADKAAAVISNEADGTVLNPGDSISLSTATEGATIYYSTDGTEPTLENLDSMLVYQGEGIEINRSVAIHAVAYKDDLRLSDVSVWNYVVDIIPAVEQKKAEEAKKAEEGLKDTDATALERHTKDSEKAEEVIVKKQYERDEMTMISYTSNVMPEEIIFETIKEKNNPLAIEKAKELYGDDNTVLKSYKFKVKTGTTPVQPTQEVEIAVPIPKGFEDAVLRVAYVEDGHNLKSLQTRREAGMLYAKTMKLGSYVVVGPEREEELDSSFSYLLLLEIVAGATLFFGIIYFLVVQIKKYFRRKKNYPKE